MIIISVVIQQVFTIFVKERTETNFEIRRNISHCVIAKRLLKDMDKCYNMVYLRLLMIQLTLIDYLYHHSLN